MKTPAFQFYPKQYLGDDKVILMDIDSQGAHVRLMCIAWQQTPPCSLPDDDEQLRKWSLVSLQEWTRVKAQVLAAWRKVRGRWVQGGLLAEYEKQKAYSESRRRNRNASHVDHMIPRKQTNENHMSGKSHEDEDVKEDASFNLIDLIARDFKDREKPHPNPDQVLDWISRVGGPRIMGILADHPGKNALYIEKCIVTAEKDNARSGNRSGTGKAAGSPVKASKTRDFGQRNIDDVIAELSTVPGEPS